MQKVAFISDIHSNLEAITAVMADIDALGITRIVCLGDIIGYGPDPVETLRLCKRCEWVIVGNHELALTEGGEKFKDYAKRAIQWTVQELRGTPEGDAYLRNIRTLPLRMTEWGHLFVHGAPTDPVNRYLLPKLSDRPEILAAEFAAFEHYCFVGHTHLPGVFEPGMPFSPAAELFMNIYVLDPKGKAIINVGSVGQPRDRDVRACYVVFDGDSVVYRRVPYDVEKTAAKIRKIPMLDDFLADRLLQGR